MTEFPGIFAVSEKAPVAKSLICLMNKLAPLVTMSLFKNYFPFVSSVFFGLAVISFAIFVKPTQKLHLSVIRNFFDMLVTRQAVVFNPTASIRGPKDTPRSTESGLLRSSTTHGNRAEKAGKGSKRNESRPYCAAPRVCRARMGRATRVEARSLAKQVNSFFGPGGLALDVRHSNPTLPLHTAHFSSSTLATLGLLIQQLALSGVGF